MGQAVKEAGTGEWCLEDIDDVQRYVATVVRRKFSHHLETGELSEALAEGICIVHELHERWDQERCRSFSAFCSTYLPLRLIDWWRREMRQRNVCRRNGHNGSYTFSGVTSLDAMVERGTEPAAACDGRSAAE